MVRRNPPTDPSKVKIASFRISEGEWFAFSEEADRQNVTATDVIKGAIGNFMTGDFVLPEPPPEPEPLPKIESMADVEKLVRTAVDTAIGRLSILTIDRVTEIARSEVELGLSQLSNDLISLQSQLAEVKQDCDLTTEGIQRLIADALEARTLALEDTSRVRTPAGLAKQNYLANKDCLTVGEFKACHPDLPAIQALAIPSKKPEVDKALAETGLDASWSFSGSRRKFVSLETASSG